MKSVWPPSLAMMRQNRERIQQGVGRAARIGKKCVNVKHLLQNVGKDDERGVPGGCPDSCCLEQSWVLH